MAAAEFDPPTIVGYRPSGLPRSPDPDDTVGGPPGPERPPVARPGPRRPVAVPPATVPAVSPPSRDGLTAAAAPLLDIVARLSTGVVQADIAQLRSKVIERIHAFDRQAERDGLPPAQVRSARYVLCAAIDEAVMTAPWGQAGDWSTNSLLNRFHGETWGGENVFAILERAKNEAAANLPLLRLIEHILLLGFEGVYRVREDGRERLEALREELRHLVGRHLPPPPADLSREWRGTGADGTLRTYLPLWIVFAVAGLLLVCLYSYQRYRLAAEVAPVVARMRALESGAAPAGTQP